MPEQDGQASYYLQLGQDSESNRWRRGQENTWSTKKSEDQSSCQNGRKKRPFQQEDKVSSCHSQRERLRRFNGLERDTRWPQHEMLPTDQGSGPHWRPKGPKTQVRQVGQKKFHPRIISKIHVFWWEDVRWRWSTESPERHCLCSIKRGCKLIWWTAFDKEIPDQSYGVDWGHFLRCHRGRRFAAQYFVQLGLLHLKSASSR